MLDGFSFYPFSLFDDGIGPAEVGVGRRHIVQALMISLVVIMFDERLDLVLQVTRQEVVLQQDAVLEGLMPAFDLALCLRMERSATHMAHLLCFDIICQFFSDVAGAVITEQTWLMKDTGLVTQPDACNASSSVSVTSSAHIVVHRLGVAPMFSVDQSTRALSQ